MKSRIEGVTLTIDSKKNSLPINKQIFGSIKLNEDLTNASFVEEAALPFQLGVRRRISLFHRSGYNVSYNTETEKYRISINSISINIDTNVGEWPLDAEDAFSDCMNYLARRTNA